jgi:mevalonate kinase
MMSEQYRANGKLLLSGEYFVLDGATSLVLPVRFGQTMKVAVLKNEPTPVIGWEAYQKGQIWFRALFNLPQLSVMETSDAETANRLASILSAVRALNPSAFEVAGSLQFETELEFNRVWGLGSSSTLIINLAAWAHIEPFKLFIATANGSGYDIAAGIHSKSFLYSFKQNLTEIREASLSDAVVPYLFFVYTGRKQKSSIAVDTYRCQKPPETKLIERISRISNNLAETDDLETFETLILEHEQILAEYLKQEPVKQLFFSDYQGVVKSLGAWGGDFVMFVHPGNREELETYLKSKSLDVLYSYDEMKCK